MSTPARASRVAPPGGVQRFANGAAGPYDGLSLCRTAGACYTSQRMTREDIDWLAAQGVPCIVTLFGPCMAPTLRDGDRVAIAPLPARLRRGDLVLVRSAQTLQLHRVVFVDATTVGHQGDAGFSPILTSRAALVGQAFTFADGALIPPAPARSRLRHLVARMWCAARALLGQAP